MIENKKIILLSGLIILVLMIIGGLAYFYQQQKKTLIKQTITAEQQRQIVPEVINQQIKQTENLATTTPSKAQYLEIEEKLKKYGVSDNLAPAMSMFIEYGSLENYARIKACPSTTDKPDSDHDCVSDEEERRRGTDSNNFDSDKDGLYDGEEIFKYHSDPNNADSDGDGFKDGQEVKGGFDPAGNGKLGN